MRQRGVGAGRGDGVEGQIDKARVFAPESLEPRRGGELIDPAPRRLGFEPRETNVYRYQG